MGYDSDISSDIVNVMVVQSSEIGKMLMVGKWRGMLHFGGTYKALIMSMKYIV